MLLESAAYKLHSVSCALKITHLQYSVYTCTRASLGMVVYVCIQVWVCVNLQYVYMSHTHTGKMEKALSFSQRIIGPLSHYEWLTHLR